MVSTWNVSDIERYEGDMVRDLVEIISIKAISPSLGGEGELDKAERICSILEKYGIDYRRIDVRDDRGYIRPNIIVEVGDGEKDLWIVSHMDVVPAGDISLWNSDPFKPVVNSGKIFGRGSEDNGQAIVASIHAARYIIERDIETGLRLNLAIVSDEETGSTYGIKALIERGIFSGGDLAIVPDAGSPMGDVIEIAEKGIVWLRIVTEGKQVHASTPHLGVNAHRLGMRLAIMVDEILHQKYCETDVLFNPPRSTFEPTRHVVNVENVNTIPGRDEVYFDCRVLPSVSIDEVVETIEEVVKRFSEQNGCRAIVEVIRRSDPAPPTREDSEIVEVLRRSLKNLRGIDPRLIGIGGGTCASYLRRIGIQTAVWQTIDETMHQANEYCVIRNLVEDCKVFVDVCIQ